MCSLPRNPLEDPALEPYREYLLARSRRFSEEVSRITRRYRSLGAYANLHKTLGLQKAKDANGNPCWRWREYMPHASALWLTTDKINFQRHASHQFAKKKNGIFELILPLDALSHNTYVELRLESDCSANKGERLRRVPAFSHYVVQDNFVPTQWCARLWLPESPYRFRHQRPKRAPFPRIYEAHVGMAQDSRKHRGESYGSYEDFTRDVLPRIKAAGYTAVQLMGIAEHPLYRSFGYQVSNYFAPCSRFGTPDQFKALVDSAHKLGLQIILDVTHAHACSNTEQGIFGYDGSSYLFNEKVNQWGTPSFDFSQEMTRRFLLSNLRYWLEEYRVDGFRFDAVGNMLYLDHGRDDDFSHVGRCFYGKDGKPRIDQSGELYICLANAMVHELAPESYTIAEEFSGMPGLTCAPAEGGLGFDARFAMGIPDYWGKCIEAPRDMGSMWYEMTNHRPYDRTISYVECHDQCINGDDAMIWRILGDSMYSRMGFEEEWKISRGLAFYRLMRLITLACADIGYLNFMGNEFGHPEWLDAEDHAHRQWGLADNPDLKYAGLANFDKALLHKIVAAHADDFKQAAMFRYIHEDHRILAFERGRLLFVFNFHELDARDDLLFAVTAGKYVELLSTDETCFAGSGNLKVATPPLEHFTEALPDRGEGDLRLYLPPMVALVLERASA